MFNISLLRALCLLLCFGLPATAVFSQTSWWQTVLSDVPVEQVHQSILHDGAWYECEGEEGDAMCLDDFRYYNQHLYGESLQLDDEIRLTFVTVYHVHTLSELMLNLRKDGLVINRIEIEGEHYDVAKALTTRSAEAVDKDVILFINRYSQQASRRIDWVRAADFDLPSPKLSATLYSDGEMIELKVTRF